MLLTIIVFILTLGLLIFSHEFGHFISAKKAGIRVEEFGFGFPPRIFGIKKGETLYSLNLIPLGGCVKIYGEERPKKRKIRLKRDKKAFYSRPVWQRAIVIVMGVIMNLFLAVVLLSIVYGIGIPTVIENSSMASRAKNVQVQIIDIAKDSPAEKAGIKIGDTIQELKTQNSNLKVNEVEDIQKFIARYAGEETAVTIKRGKDILEKRITARISPPEGEGPIGVVLAKTGIIKYPWYTAILQGIKSTGQLIMTFLGLFYQLLKTLILKGVLIGELTGPVGIATMTSQMTKLGFVYILQFIAVISINLAIINAIPFPALDGGRLLFLAIEKIKGSPVSAKIEQLVNNMGFALLIILMIVVTFRDIVRLF